MLLLGLDIETGCFGTDDVFITEVGAVLYDTKYRQPIDIYSKLVNANKEITDEAREYTEISTELVELYGVPESIVYSYLAVLMEKASYIVAHNGNSFDKPILEKVFKEWKYNFPEVPWIDTQYDIRYPSNCRNRSLGYLRDFHNVSNPFKHRAAFDALSMLEILMKYDLDEVIRVANSPQIELVFKVKYPNRRDFGSASEYDEGMSKFNELKDKVKSANFRWDANKKEWVLKTRKAMVEGKTFEFPVTERILND